MISTMPTVKVKIPGKVGYHLMNSSIEYSFVYKTKYDNGFAYDISLKIASAKILIMITTILEHLL